MLTRIIILLVATLVQLSAATYYVDFVGGSDSNDGLSTSTAWKRCPGDTSATGTPAAASLSPGDTIRFKGGVAYVGQIRTDGDGTFGNPIIYEGGDISGWGTGYGIIDGTGISAASWTSTHRGLLNLPSFSVMRNLLVTNAAPNNAAYAQVSLAGSFITVSNCATGGGSGGANGGNGFQIYRGSGASGTNYTFVNCSSISNAWHGFFAVGTLTNVFYTNCYAQWNGVQTGTYADGWFIGDNSFGYPNNVILSECVADNHPQKGGMIFEPVINAMMDRCTVTGTNAFGVAVINTQYSTAICSNITLQNCVIDVDTAVSGAPLQIKASNNSFTNGIKDVKLLNNTFRIRKGGDNTAVVWAQTQTTTFIEGVYATNNIICTGSNSITLVNLNARTTNCFFDYNLYWTNRPARVNVEFVTNGTNTTPVNWWPQQEANSALRRLTNNVGVDASFMPVAGGAAVDNGLSLSGLFNNDRVGTLRPQGAGWDIGVYELVIGVGTVSSRINSGFSTGGKAFRTR